MKRFLSMCILLIGVLVLNTVSYSTDVISKTEFNKVIKTDNLSVNPFVLAMPVEELSPGSYSLTSAVGNHLIKISLISITGKQILKEDIKVKSCDILSSSNSFKFISDRSAITFHSYHRYKYPDYKAPVISLYNCRQLQHRS